MSVAVTPAAGGAALSALPSAVQDLARFFLSLSGSSSLGAVGGVAGVAAPTAGSGFSCALRLLQLVQSHLVLRLRYLLELVILLLPAAVLGGLAFAVLTCFLLVGMVASTCGGIQGCLLVD